MATSSIVRDRKDLKRRDKMGGGYTIFYGLLLGGIAIAASFFLSGSAGVINLAIPAHLYNTIVGNLYIYNAVSLILIWLSAFFFPRPYLFGGLRDNAWNMLYKMGIRPGALALNKVRVTLLSQLMAYLLGFVLVGGVAYLQLTVKVIDVKLTLLLACIGLCAIIIFVTPTLAVGAMTHGKGLLRLLLVALLGIVGYILYLNGYFIYAKSEDITHSATKLISLNPLGLLLISLLCAILFPILTVSSANSRARRYRPEDLDTEDLVSMGVAENMLVLTRNRNRFAVAISGPRIHGSNRRIDLPDVSDAEDFSESAALARSRRRKKDADDNEDEE